MEAQLASMLVQCFGARGCGNNCGINTHVPPPFSRRMTPDQREPSVTDTTASERGRFTIRYNAYMIGVCPRDVLGKRGWRAPIFVGETRCAVVVTSLSNTATQGTCAQLPSPTLAFTRLALTRSNYLLDFSAERSELIMKRMLFAWLAKTRRNRLHASTDGVAERQDHLLNHPNIGRDAGFIGACFETLVETLQDRGKHECPQTRTF